MKRKRYNIEYMPNLDEFGMNKFFENACNADPSKAAYLANAERTLFYSNPRKARVVYDSLTKRWHGRKARALREALGLRRVGAKAGSVRDVLRDVLGEEKSYWKHDLIATISEALKCDLETAESKWFQQGKARRALVCDRVTTGTWRFYTAPLPDASDFPPEDGTSRFSFYLRVYGNMPAWLKHQPGEVYKAQDSQVLKWMSEKSGSADFKWLEKEFDRVRRYGRSADEPKAVFIYDANEQGWCGRLSLPAKAETPKVVEPVTQEDLDAEAKYYNSLVTDNIAILRAMPPMKTDFQITRYLKKNIKGEYDADALCQLCGDDNIELDFWKYVLQDEYKDDPEVPEGKDWLTCGIDNYGGEDPRGNGRLKGSKWLQQAAPAPKPAPKVERTPEPTPVVEPVKVEPKPEPVKPEPEPKRHIDMSLEFTVQDRTEPNPVLGDVADVWVPPDDESDPWVPPYEPDPEPEEDFSEYDDAA
jgi:hypothetical protein